MQGGTRLAEHRGRIGASSNTLTAAHGNAYPATAVDCRRRPVPMLCSELYLYSLKIFISATKYFQNVSTGVIGAAL
jgi:hypothetical protein